MRRRTLTIKIPPLARGEVEKFIERVLNAVKVDSVVYRVESGSIKINMYGSDTQIRESLSRIKSIVKEYTVIDRGRYRYYSREAIINSAGGPIPLDVLTFILRAMGYEVKEADNGIETTADHDIIEYISTGIWSILGKLAYLDASRSVKKALIAASILLQMDPDELLDKVLEAKLVKQDKGNILPLASWTKITETLLTRIREDKSGDMG